MLLFFWVVRVGVGWDGEPLKRTAYVPPRCRPMPSKEYTHNKKGAVQGGGDGWTTPHTRHAQGEKLAFCASAEQFGRGGGKDNDRGMKLTS